MILVDINLLIYATIPSLPQHAASRRWWDDTINDGGRVGLPWSSLIGFVRLTTRSALFEPALSLTQAWQQVDEWLSLPNVHVPTPGDGHRAIFDELVRSGRGSARMIDDMHLAALAIEHGLLLCSADAGFARFPSLRWKNPIEGAHAGV